MADSSSESERTQQRGGWFPSTHWSVVLSAGQDSSPDARESFGRLYQEYLPPLFAYLRREGRPEDEARELVQGFFEYLLERRALGRVQREGKFRSWLLICLKNYLGDVWDKNRALKRGGQAVHVLLGKQEGEREVDPQDPGRTPDQEFDRQFALQFVASVVARLEREYRTRGKGDLFEALHPFLLDKKGSLSHAEIGAELNLSENAISQEVSRLRKSYRAVFDEELGLLVGMRAEVEEEKRYLLAALRT